MTTPWIEVKKHNQLDVPAGPGYRDYIWQAQFACQVEILSHQEWVKLKWGFNASALFDETLERQRLFLESQYEVRHQIGVDAPDYRTLAFRYIGRPGEGLFFIILGKIHAKTEKEAMESALSYYKEVCSTFPYDYTLIPARSRQEFIQISGNDILDGSGGQVDLAQIKRLELPLPFVRNSPFLQGVWRSGNRAHEQIWRSLAASSVPVLLNITLRCTVLYEKEREKLLQCAEEISSLKQPLNQQTLSAMQQWNSKYGERRLGPWGKFFYLQIHLASTRKLSKDLFRTIGNALAMNSGGEPLPGWRVILPDSSEAPAWCERIRDLELVFSDTSLPVPRLSEVADLDEVFAAIRLPYSPPENGFPDMSFVTIKY